MRRAVVAVIAALAVSGGSAAVAWVTSIDDAAAVSRTAHRLAPRFRPDLPANERVGLEKVDLVDRERNRRGLPVFRVHELVTEAAIVHSGDMAARRSMVHLGADGPETGARLERAGFTAGRRQDRE